MSDFLEEINHDKILENLIHEKNLEVEKLTQENKKLREALEFYADEMSYSLDDYCGISGEMRMRVILYKDSEERNDCYSFAGRLARKTLREIDGGGK